MAREMSGEMSGEMIETVDADGLATKERFTG